MVDESPEVWLEAEKVRVSPVLAEMVDVSSEVWLEAELEVWLELVRVSSALKCSALRIFPAS